MKYLLVILIVLLAAVAWHFKDRLLPSPHDAYYAALVRENLDASAERWRFEAEESLANPIPITLPYSERRLLEAAHLQPITFTFDLKADQLIQVEIFPSVNTRAEVFVDVFFLNEKSAQPTRIGSMVANEQQIKLAAERGGREGGQQVACEHAVESPVDGPAGHSEGVRQQHRRHQRDQDDRVTAFKDINPVAPVHILIIPNQEIPTVDDVTPEDEAVLGHLFVVARQIAREQGIAEPATARRRRLGAAGDLRFDRLLRRRLVDQAACAHRIERAEYARLLHADTHRAVAAHRMT